jgi:hypothetical protein
MLAVLPYENKRGSDGDGFLVYVLSEVVLRSWRSIWRSSCCRGSCAAMVWLTRQSLSNTEDDMGIYSRHFISQITVFLVPSYCYCYTVLVEFLLYTASVKVCARSVEIFAVSILSAQPGMYPWGLWSLIVLKSLSYYVIKFSCQINQAVKL